MLHEAICSRHGPAVGENCGLFFSKRSKHSHPYIFKEKCIKNIIITHICMISAAVQLKTFSCRWRSIAYLIIFIVKDPIDVF